MARDPYRGYNFRVAIGDIQRAGFREVSGLDEAQDPVELAAAHRRQSPPELRAAAPHIPASIAKLVRHMLSKEPFRRPTTSELVSRLVELEIDTFTERNSTRQRVPTSMLGQ